jgi:predicted nucleotidyltransferase
MRSCERVYTSLHRSDEKFFERLRNCGFLNRDDGGIDVRYRRNYQSPICVLFSLDDREAAVFNQICSDIDVIVSGSKQIGFYLFLQHHKLLEEFTNKLMEASNEPATAS